MSILLRILRRSKITIVASHKTGSQENVLAEIYQLYTDYGVKAFMLYDDEKGEPDGGYRAYVFTDLLSSGDLVRLSDQVEAEVRAKLGIPFNPSRTSAQCEVPSVSAAHPAASKIGPLAESTNT